MGMASHKIPYSLYVNTQGASPSQIHLRIRIRMRTCFTCLHDSSKKTLPQKMRFLGYAIPLGRRFLVETDSSEKAISRGILFFGECNFSGKRFLEENDSSGNTIHQEMNENLLYVFVVRAVEQRIVRSVVLGRPPLQQHTLSIFIRKSSLNNS